MSTPALNVAHYTDAHCELVNEFLLRARKSMDAYFLGVTSTLAVREGLQPSRRLFEKVLDAPDLPTCVRIVTEWIAEEKGRRAGVS